MANNEPVEDWILLMWNDNNLAPPAVPPSPMPPTPPTPPPPMPPVAPSPIAPTPILSMPPTPILSMPPTPPPPPVSPVLSHNITSPRHKLKKLAKNKIKSNRLWALGFSMCTIFIIVCVKKIYH
jgi:hypothetical protein